MRKITPKQVETFLTENYPNLDTALQNQNQYSYLEALEDLTDLINKIKVVKNEYKNKESNITGEKKSAYRKMCL